MSDEQYIGEVIEASTSEFTAESCTLHEPPRFGSFVRIPLSGPDGPEEADPQPLPQTEPQGRSEDPFDFRTAGGSFSQDFDAVMGGGTIGRLPSLQPAIYAVVCSATTTSTETGKQPRAYWKDEEELAREQPQLAEWLLMTKFQAAIIGYSEYGQVRQYLPPVPPKIHTRVYQCTEEEVSIITLRMDFLRTLINFRNTPCDEMVAACIREAGRMHRGNSELLVSAGKELANLLKDDYERLHAIVRRIVP